MILEMFIFDAFQHVLIDCVVMRVIEPQKG
jgi:hypothetical protein